MDSLLVYGVEVDSNCTQGIERGFGCGAMKIVGSSNFIFRRGHIHHNFGNGWWVDRQTVNSSLDSSLVRFNWGTGVFCEISFGCVIAYNTIEDNGQQPQDAFQNGTGILCSASEDCWIHHNTVQRNAHGINTLQQYRGGHIVADALVEYNVITSNRGTHLVQGGLRAVAAPHRQEQHLDMQYEQYERHRGLRVQLPESDLRHLDGRGPRHAVRDRQQELRSMLKRIRASAVSCVPAAAAGRSKAHLLNLARIPQPAGILPGPRASSDLNALYKRAKSPSQRPRSRGLWASRWQMRLVN